MPTFGFKLPNCGGIMCRPEWADPNTLRDLAGHVAELGFDAAWLHEHLLMPAELKHLGAAPIYDPLTVMGHLLASVPRIRIGTAAMILPLNEPVSLARRMMTMQAFAPGRAIFGVGAGQYESEFAAFGSDLFGKRGKVTEEYLTLIRALHEGGTVTVPGQFRSVIDGVFHPGAQTVGRAPIWVAGNAPAAVRRAGRHGDGWICAARPLEDVRAGVQMVREVVAGTGRNPDADFAVALSTTLVRDAPGRRPRDGGLHEHSRNISGGADEIADALSGFAQAGVDHVILTFAVDELTDLKDDLEWFATAVAPAVGATAAAG